jgi:hypothetical protein
LKDDAGAVDVLCGLHGPNLCTNFRDDEPSLRAETQSNYLKNISRAILSLYNILHSNSSEKKEVMCLIFESRTIVPLEDSLQTSVDGREVILRV